MSISPVHGAVLGAAAVVASPALWLTVVEGTLPLSDALLRYLLSVLLCWAALNVVGQLAFPSQESVRARIRESEAGPAESDESA